MEEMAVQATRTALLRLGRNSTVFLCCDMQERFRQAICHFTEITEVSRRLIMGAKLMKIPLLITEQYPQGLGHTVPELMSVADGYAAAVISKTKFSMCVPELEPHLGSAKTAVRLGIEGQVCVLQTALDLLRKGVGVHVVADATSSRTQVCRHLALQRMRDAGAIITSAESVLFELMGDKNDENFKAVQGLVKEPSPDSGLLPI